jgi:hypothetical protein
LFCWSPCCRLAPTSWQPCSSSWSTPGALLSDHGGWSVLLEYLWWCLGVVLGVLEIPGCGCSGEWNGDYVCVLWTPLSPMVLCLVTIHVVMTAHAMHGVCVLLVDGPSL